MKVKVTQLCPTLWDPMDYTVHGILQGSILEWVDFLLLQGIFPTQGSNPGVLHYRQILYGLSHQGSPVWHPAHVEPKQERYTRTPNTDLGN